MPSPAPFDRSSRPRHPAHGQPAPLAAWAERRVTLRDLERCWARHDRRRARRQAVEVSWWAALVMCCGLAWFGAYELTGALWRLF